MTDVDEARPGRQLASNLRELMKQVDIRAGTERERDKASESQASVRDIFARARTAIPTPSIASSSSRVTRPRQASFNSDVSAPSDQLDDDGSTIDTPIARIPPAAASLHALRARLESASDATSDLTGWDRSARSLMTTRGQASSSRLDVYEGSNLLDEDLGDVPALTVSHVDDTLRFQPSVGNSSRTPIAPRQRPNAIPKGPSLQSASIADRLAGIPDDGLDFDDNDREDFDRNRMDDDSDDLLHQENDLLRSASPPPPDSPQKQSPASRQPRQSASTRPISGSWENVLPEGSVMSLPNVEERSRKPAGPALGSSSGSGSGSGSRLMQAIQDEEDSYQRSQQEKTQQDDINDDSTDKSKDTTARSASTVVKSRLSTAPRTRLPLAKPAVSTTPQSHPPNKPGVSEITFPQPSSPAGSPTKREPPRPDGRLGAPEPSHIPRPTSPSPGRPPSRLEAPLPPESPERLRSRVGSAVPVTPSRIPRVSMHSSHPSWDGSPGDGSPSRLTRSSISFGANPTSTTPARASSSMGMNAPATTPNRRGTPGRPTSSLGVRESPLETDIDRERAWGKPLPKLTHANLRMRHDQMDTVQSFLSGLSPDRPGSVVGGPRPTTPSFVGYSRKGTSEVSSSQGSAGSDEDTAARRARKLSIASAQGTKSGRELRGSSLTSPTASSLARSNAPGLARHSSLKTPSKGAAKMRHSLSFTGSPSASSMAGSERGAASPINSPRKLMTRHSAEVVSSREYEHIRERDWGRPMGSRAIGVANVRPRVGSGGSPNIGGRRRVASGGSVEGSESPIPRTRTTSSVRPRPHTVHLSYSTPNLEDLSGRRAPLEGGEELLERDDEEASATNESVLEWRRHQAVVDALEEETEVEDRPESPSPPSPSRSIPLPPSPPPHIPRVKVQPPAPAQAPTDASVSLFRDVGAGKVPEAESTTRGESASRATEPEPAHPESPKHPTFAQPDSPTISFMDTLPPLPEPPSDEEMSVVIPPIRPTVNTRLNRLAREPSPGSGGSGSEKTPRASTLALRTPTPPDPEPAKPSGELKLSGLEPAAGTVIAVVPDRLEVPRPHRVRSRSNTLGTTLPRIEVDMGVSRDEIDSAATPVATRWMAASREQRGDKIGDVRGPGESVRGDARGALPLGTTAPVRRPSPLASTSPPPVTAQPQATAPSTLRRQNSEPQMPAMMSQKGKEILQRMQQEAATLARDLQIESRQPVPQGDEVQAETEQIVKLSTAARAERERLEKLRNTRNSKDKVVTVEVPVRRRSFSWILFSFLLTALCAWLALYALSHHATNVYLDPLYPVLYGDMNPLRHARTVDSFPSSWNVYLVSKPGIQQWLTTSISPLSHKLWAIPNQTIQHLMSNWPPS